MDPRGDGGPWEDIKRLIKCVVTINATVTQVAKGARIQSLNPMQYSLGDMVVLDHYGAKSSAGPWPNVPLSIERRGEFNK